MRHPMGSLAESMAVLGSATLAGVACCGPIVIQWMGLLVWAAGGRMLLMWLVHYEIPILIVIGVAGIFRRRLAPDRLTRWVNTLFAGIAFFLAALRAIWEVQRGAVMAVEPVYQLFIYRQTVLLAAAGLVFIVRLALLAIALRRRSRSPQACPAPAVWQEGSQRIRS